MKTWTTGTLTGLAALLAAAAAPAQEAATQPAPDEIPAAVRAAVEARLGAEAAVEIESEREGGETIYEAEWDEGGLERSIELTAEGVIIEEEREISAAELPAAVSAALAAQWPGATVREAEEITATLYEVEIQTENGLREVTVSPTGRIRGEEHEDDEDDDQEDVDDDD